MIPLPRRRHGAGRLEAHKRLARPRKHPSRNHPNGSVARQLLRMLMTRQSMVRPKLSARKPRQSHSTRLVIRQRMKASPVAAASLHPAVYRRARLTNASAKILYQQTMLPRLGLQHMCCGPAAFPESALLHLIRLVATDMPICLRIRFVNAMRRAIEASFCAHKT